MKHKRIHVRVPLHGNVVLSNSNHPTIKAHAIDISQGGVAVAAFSEEACGGEYQIEILTESGMTIKITAQLVRVEDSIAGFKTIYADYNTHEFINNLVFEYQGTVDFIMQLDEYNLHKVLDEEGNEIEIEFDDEN